MANITQWLEKIKTAMFGKDVRDAIYNSINSMNNEVVSNTSKQNALETKYNNQIKNMTQSNPSLVEVVDARVSDIGINYDTLGDRLNAERTDSDINLLRSTELSEDDDLTLWRISNYISIDNNVLTPNGNRSFHFYVEDNTANFSVGQQQVKLISGGTYAFSAWVLLSEGAADNENINFQISYIKPDETTIWRNENINASMLNMGKWVLISKTFTLGEIKEGTNASISVQCAKAKFHGYVGNIKLQLGKHATDRSPNPKDLVYQANQYTEEVKATIDSDIKRYFVKLKPTEDFAFVEGEKTISFDKVVWKNNMDNNTIKSTGLYRIDVNAAIYFNKTIQEDKTVFCAGDISFLINNQEVQKDNFGLVLEPNHASTIKSSYIGKLNEGDVVTIKTNNTDYFAGTFDFRAENSWLSIYKI